MLLLENLEFYDQRGVKQASSFDSVKNIHTFELVFDEISVGLFSTQQIHIFERCINKVDNQSFLSNPRTTDNQEFKFKFRNPYYENFFLYRIDFDTISKSYYVSTVTRDSANIDLQTEEFSSQRKSALSDDTLDNNYSLNKNEISSGVQKILTSISSPLKDTTEVLSLELLTSESQSYISDGTRYIIEYNNSIDTTTLNLGFLANREKEYQEILEIYIVENSIETLIAEVSLFSTAIAEDERLNTLLTNFGQQLTVEDSIIFRDTDVNEDLSNHIVLNSKKKEMILEFSNIIPYIGSYKGLINALKFYGYADLRLKEWWINLELDEPKIFQEEVNTSTFRQSNTGKFNPNIKKTGKFSLVYDITRPSGEVDEFGLPEVEEAFMFTPEEVILKLFGLKQMLKNKYLPLGTRIVDITGEGVYFSRISTQTWTSQLQIIDSNQMDYDIKISIDDTTVFINNVDTSTYSNIFPYQKEFKLSDLADTPLSNVSTIHLDSFEYNENLYDSPNRIGYAEVELRNETFSTTWEDIDILWEDIPKGNLASLDTINAYPFYEIEWIVSGNGTNPFYLNRKGNIEQLNTLTFQTSYTGNYDVTVKLKDLYTNVYVKRYPNMFSVELPNPRFGVIYNHINQIMDYNTVETLETAEYTILGDQLVSDLTLEDLDITWESLDPINYMGKEVLTDFYDIDIVELNRNNEYIYISKDDVNISDIEKQKYVTFVNQKPTEFVEPQEIKDIDSENSYIYIDTQKEIILNDLIEVYVSTEVTDYTLSENVLVIQGVLRSSVLNGVKVYFGNYEEDITLTSKSVSIDEFEGVTTIVLDDSDMKTFSRTFTILEVLSDFATYEILEAEYIDGLWKVKVDWNSLTIQNKQTYDLGIPKPPHVDETTNVTITFDFYNLVEEAQRFDIDVITNLIIGKRRTLYPYVNFNDDLLSEKIRTVIGDNILSAEVKTRAVDEFIRTGYRPTSLEFDITFETFGQLDNFTILQENFTSEKLKCWWGLCYGEHSVEVLEVDKDFSDTLIKVKFKDTNRELFYITKNFKCRFTSFDVQTALKYGCRTSIRLEDCYNLTWKDADHINFDTAELSASHLCGFKVYGVDSGDTLTFNNSRILQFSNISTLSDVANQLSSSDIREFKNFEYIVYDDYVHAVAKSYSQECLGLLKFDGNLVVEPRISTNLGTSLPLPQVMNQEENYAEGTKNNRMLWDKRIRDWVYNGETYVVDKSKIDSDILDESNMFQTFQDVWSYSVNGNFRWNNIKVSEDSVLIPKMTIVYFYGDISEIIGKSKYVWKIIDDFATETLIETTNDRISYMFDREGSYSVSLTVYDSLGNFSEMTKKSYIIVK